MGALERARARARQGPGMNSRKHPPHLRLALLHWSNDRPIQLYLCVCVYLVLLSRRDATHLPRRTAHPSCFNGVCVAGNHIMFGGPVGGFFYKFLGGVQALPQPNAAGKGRPFSSYIRYSVGIEKCPYCQRQVYLLPLPTHHLDPHIERASHDRKWNTITGYREFLLTPPLNPCLRLESTTTSFLSNRGPIRHDWKQVKGGLQVRHPSSSHRGRSHADIRGFSQCRPLKALWKVTPSRHSIPPPTQCSLFRECTHTAHDA